MPAETIAAISTPLGEGGIGIVRLSGPRAISIVKTFFRSPKKPNLSKQPSHSVSYGFIVNPKSKNRVDEALVTIMRAPRTYTREDVAEINCHGGIRALKETLELALEAGARLAEPGEFTKRAFLNGRIDLAQAEAVIDVIRAKTDASLRVAMKQLGGHLSRKVESLRQALLEITAHLEAAIDFSDEDIEPFPPRQLAVRAEGVSREISKLIGDADRGKILREGITTAIVGRPNVGKSSLLNALLREERAIVTSRPGTTRDIIEETVNIRGIPLKLQDTAGLRNPRGLAEGAGVQKSRDSLKSADLVLVVIDSSEPLMREDFNLFEETAGKKNLVVLNKSDLPHKVDEEGLKALLNGSKAVKVSATEGLGLDLLENTLAGLVFSGAIVSTEEPLVSNVRHQMALKRANQSLIKTVDALKSGMPEEIAALLIREALDGLGEIVGETTTGDLLKEIFSQFCVGK